MIQKCIKFSVKITVNRGFFFALVFLSFSFLLLLNFLTPYCVDDYWYLYMWNDRTARVCSLYDVIVSQWSHYMTWGGRSVAHCLAQFFLIYDKWVFNILNAITYVVFTLLVYIHSVGRWKYNVHIYLLIHIFLWNIFNGWGQCFLPLTMSCNYLWTSTLVLLFLLPFRLSLPNSVWLKVLMLIGGILAGWSNENTAVSVLAFLVFYLVYKKTNNLQIESWEYIGLVSFCAGTALLLLAPGNYCRMNNAWHFWDSLKLVFRRFDISSKASVMLIGMLLFYRKQVTIEKIHVPLVYLFLSLGSHLAMLGSPRYVERSTIPVVYFGIIALCCFINQINFNENRVLKSILYAIYACFVACSPVAMWNTVQNSRVILENQKEMVQQILEQKKHNINDIKLYGHMKTRNKHLGYCGLNLYQDASYIINTIYAEHFGVNTISAVGVTDD